MKCITNSRTRLHRPLAAGLLFALASGRLFAEGNGVPVHSSIPETAPTMFAEIMVNPMAQLMLFLVGLGFLALIIEHFLSRRPRSDVNAPLLPAELERAQRRLAFRTGLFITIVYFEICAAWILFSDDLYELFKKQPETIPHIKMGVRIVFVLLTALLLMRMIPWMLKQFATGRASLAERDHLMRLALEGTNQGFYDLDLRTGKARVTPEYATMLGYSPEDIKETHERWMERLHPEDREKVERAFDDYIADRARDYRVEYRQRSASGEWRWILSLGKIIERDKDGKPLRMLGTHTDITPLKVAEAQVAEKAESLRQLSGHLLESQDMERRRVARDLHDTTAQHLAALSMNLSVIERLVGDEHPKVIRILVDSEALVDKATQEIRSTTYLLHPPLLDAAGLAGALQDYVEGFARRSGLNIATQIPKEFERMPRDVELAFFRVVQEGLSNIRRHSQSSTATVSLAHNHSEVILEMRDDGVGIPAEKLARFRNMTGELGVGIAGMSERLKQLGGRLEIESNGKGTAVRAVWPIPQSLNESE